MKHTQVWGETRSCMRQELKYGSWLKSPEPRAVRPSSSSSQAVRGHIYIVEQQVKQQVKHTYIYSRAASKAASKAYYYMLLYMCLWRQQTLSSMCFLLPLLAIYGSHTTIYVSQATAAIFSTLCLQARPRGSKR